MKNVLRKSAFVGVFLFCSSTQLFAQEQRPDYRQRAYYVENAVDALMRNGRPGELFNLANLNEQFRQCRDRGGCPSQTMHETLRQGGEKINDLNALAANIQNYKAGANSSEATQAAVRLLGKLNGPVGEKAASIFNDAVGLGRSAAGFLLGPDAQREAQTQLANQVDFFNNRGRTELYLALEYSADPEYKKAFNDYFASKVGVTTDTQADQILSVNRALANRTLTYENNQLLESFKKEIERIAADGSVDANEVKELVAKANVIASSNFEQTKQILALVNSLESSRLTEGERIQKEKELAEKREALDKFTRDSQAVTGLVTSFLQFYDPKVARAFNVTSNAAIQIIDSVGKYGLNGMSGIVMTGNVVGAALSIASVFGPQQPDMLDLLTQQLDSIRQQIQGIFLVMNARFDLIDQKLDRIYETLLTNFELIRHDTKALLDKVEQLQADLEHLRIDMRQRFEDLSKQETDAVTKECLDYKIHFPKGRIPDPDLNRCLSRFTYWANAMSRLPSHTANSIPIFNTLADPTVIRQNREKLKDNQILSGVVDDLNLPIDRMEVLSRVSNILRGSSLSGSNRSLANVTLWKLGSESYIRLLSDWSRTSQPDVNCDLEALIDTGGELSHAVREIGKVTPQSSERSFANLLSVRNASTNVATLSMPEDDLGAISPLFARLVSEARQSLVEVDDAVSAVGQDYLQEQQITFRDGAGDNLGSFLYDAPYQAANFKNAEAVFVGAYFVNRKVDGRWQSSQVPINGEPYKIPLDDVITKAFVPSAYIVAERLGLGEIVANWGVQIPQPIPCDPDDDNFRCGDHHGGRLGLVFEFKVSEKGKAVLKRTISDRPVQWPIVQGTSLGFMLSEVQYLTANDHSLADCAQYVTNNWTSGDNLRKRFLEAATISTAEQYRNNVKAEQIIKAFLMKLLVDAELNKDRKALSERIINSLAGKGPSGENQNGPFQNALLHYEASRLMLKTFVEVGLSQSVRSNDKLAAFLYGPPKRTEDAVGMFETLISPEVLRNKYILVFSAVSRSYTSRIDDLIKERDKRFVQSLQELQGTTEWTDAKVKRLNEILAIDKEDNYYTRSTNPIRIAHDENANERITWLDFSNVLAATIKAHPDGEQLDVIETTLARLRATKSVLPASNRVCPR